MKKVFFTLIGIIFALIIILFFVRSLKIDRLILFKSNNISIISKITIHNNSTLELYLQDNNRKQRPLILFINRTLKSNIAVEKMMLSLLDEKVNIAALNNDSRLLTIADIRLTVEHIQQQADHYQIDHQRITALAYDETGPLLASAITDSNQAIDTQLLAGAIIIGSSLARVEIATKFSNKSVNLNNYQHPLNAWPVNTSKKTSSSYVPLLLLSGAKGGNSYAISHYQFEQKLFSSNYQSVTRMVLQKYNHETIMDWNNNHSPMKLIKYFIGINLMSKKFIGQVNAESKLRRLPIRDTKKLWLNKSLIKKYPIDAIFKTSLKRLFQNRLYELNALPLKHYYAVDLLDFIESQQPENNSKGDFLVITNVQGRKLYFTLSEIRKLRPQLVIGIDEIENLFKLAISYRTKQQYSWVDDDPTNRPWMARPFGAFLHLAKSESFSLKNKLLKSPARFGLNSKSFEWFKNNPLNAIKPPLALLQSIKGTRGCISCHSINGAGANSFHMSSDNYKPSGGYALPLELYSDQVLYNFIYHQKKVADTIGVSTNHLNENIRGTFLQYIKSVRNL